MHTPDDHAASTSHPGHVPSSPGTEPAAAAAPADPKGPFTVRLRFSGLCLFVPEPAGGVNPNGELAAMHVLLMNAGDDTPMHGWSRPAPCFPHGHHPGGSGSHPKHYSMLYVDEAHLAPRRQLTGRPVGIALKDTRLELPGTGGTISHDEPLSTAILPLHEISEAKGLRREWIEAKPGRQVAAQIVLTAGKPGDHPTGTRVAIRHPGASSGEEPEEWKWPIATEVEWILPEAAAAPFEVALQNIDTRDQQGDPLKLYPVVYPVLHSDGREVRWELRREIRVNVCCLPLYELPGGAPGRLAQANERVEHFGAFFSVLPEVREAPELFVLGGAMRGIDTTGTSVCTTAWAALADG